MKTHVTFRFRESWFENIVQENESFMEEMCAALNRFRDVEVLDSAETYIKVALEEDVVKDTIDSVGYILRGCYKEEYPFRNMEVIGDAEEIASDKLRGFIYSGETERLERQEEENRKRAERGLCPLPKDTVLHKYPVKFSADMPAYIEEIHHVVPMLEKMGLQNKFYSKNLLISIDEGWGYSAFLDAVAKELLAIGAAESCPMIFSNG